MSGIFIYFSSANINEGRTVAKFVDNCRPEHVSWDRDADSFKSLSGAVRRSIQKSDAVIVLWSSNTANSNRCREVMKLGEDDNKLIIICLDQTPLVSRLQVGSKNRVFALAEFYNIEGVLPQIIAAQKRSSSGVVAQVRGFFGDFFSLFSFAGSDEPWLSDTMKLYIAKLVALILNHFKRKVIYSVIMLAMFLGYKNFAGGSKVGEAELWQQAVSADDIAGYKKYLEQYANGKYALAAQHAQNDLAYVGAWELAKKENTVTSYEHFLDSWPDGYSEKYGHEDFHALAVDELNSIDRAEDAAWMKALDEDDLNGYQSYLMDWAKGRHASDADGIINEMLRNGLFGTIQRSDVSYSSVGWAGNGKELMFADVQGGWGYVGIKTQKVTMLAEGHTGPVFAAAVIPADARVVTAGGDGLVKVWAQKQLKPLKILQGHDGAVYGVAFSGKLAVSAGADGTLRLWDLQQGRQTQKIDAHSGGSYSVAVSRDGRRIASGGAHGDICIWDRFTGQMLRRIEAHQSAVNTVAFSPDGTHVVSGSADNALKLWSLNDGKLALVLKGHTDKVNVGAFTPDGNNIVSASSDASLKIWDAQTGALVRTMEGHSGEIFGMALSPDGKQAISAGGDGTIKLWTLSPEPIKKVSTWLGLERTAIY